MHKLFFSIAILGLIIFSGCEKKDTLPERYTPTSTEAYFKFLYMSPDGPSVLMYANGTKITSIAPGTTNNEELGLSFGNVYPVPIGYGAIPTGNIKFEGKVPASSPVLPNTTIITKDAAIEQKKFYTLAVVDSLSRLSAVVFEDDLSVPDPTKAYFRIMNLMPNSAAKIEITNVSSNVQKPTVSSLAFKAVTSFDTLTNGLTYKFLLKNPANDARWDSVNVSAPPAGRKFTLYIRGVSGQTGTSTKRPLIFAYANL